MGGNNIKHSPLAFSPLQVKNDILEIRPGFETFEGILDFRRTLVYSAWIPIRDSCALWAMGHGHGYSHSCAHTAVSCCCSLCQLAVCHTTTHTLLLYQAVVRHLHKWVVALQYYRAARVLDLQPPHAPLVRQVQAMAQEDDATDQDDNLRMLAGYNGM